MKWEESGVPGENPRRQAGLEPMHMGTSISNGAINFWCPQGCFFTI